MYGYCCRNVFFFFFNSVKKEKVIPYFLMPFFLGIFKNAHVTFIKLRDIEKEADIPSS